MARRMPGSWKKVKKMFIQRCKQLGDLICTRCNTQLVENVHPPVKQSLTIDHIVPISMGGSKLSHKNMRLVCLQCNNEMNEYLQQFSKSTISKLLNFKGE